MNKIISIYNDIKPIKVIKIIPSKKLSWKNFFFPYYPLKFFKSIQLITLFAFLLALHIILVYVGFNLPIVNLSIGFDWIPTYLAGWFFGPIIGPIFGFVANNISWLQTGGQFWFWMYAIQEPIIALYAAIVSYIYYYRINKISLLFDVLFQQITIFSFFVLSAVLISLSWINQIPINANQTPQNTTSVFNLYVSAIVIMCIGFLLQECYVFYKIKTRKKIYNLKIFLYASSIICSMIFLFAIAVGPLTTARYLAIFFFAPNEFNTRLYFINVIAPILMQVIRVPIAILILDAALIACIKPFEKLKNSIDYKKVY